MSLSFAGFEYGEGHVAKNAGGILGSEGSPQLIASREMGIRVLQLQEVELYHSSVDFDKDTELNLRVQPF